MEDPKAILKRIRRLELKTRGFVDAAFAGQYRSVFKGSGMNFEEVREYQPGDEVRSIDWNVTARAGTPHVKKFTEERELNVLLIVDVSASGEYGSIHASKRELAAEVACILAFSAIRNNDKVGALLFSDHVERFIPLAKGRGHALRLIRDILFFEPQGRGTDIAQALAYANRVLERKSVLFLLSDFVSKNFEHEFRITARRHDLIAMHVSDPRERELPNMGHVMLEDPETGDQIEVNTSSRSVRATYAKLLAARDEALKREFSRNGVDSIALSTGADYLSPLRKFFRARERRLALR
jgi:uncharacterized protein (DUF58 family)